jgi:radical SAM enzyme (TIGR01210 family)
LPVVKERSRAQTPIYVGKRRFLGAKDLVVSFYTEKCQFECRYCALPLRSANAPVSIEDLNAQIDGVFEEHAGELATFDQFSFGNEGSAFDRQRFFPASMNHLLARTKAMTKLRVLSIETRPEYVTAEALEAAMKQTTARVDVTVGLETQDDKLRIEVLNKKVTRRTFEDRVGILGALGATMTSYVLVKPGLRMTEADGIKEAVATIAYLSEVCATNRVPLTIYLTPTYIAEGSVLGALAKKDGYLPPTIQSIFQIIVEGRKYGAPIYAGLWSEGLAADRHDFRGRHGYDPALRNALVQFNRTNDFNHLEPFLYLLEPGIPGFGPTR